MDLGHVSVLDLTRLLPGPYGTQLLADMGAEVIKVEDPNLGDYARETDEDPSYFDAINQGKESIVLDLKTAAGTETFLRLAEDADVVFEQFRPGVVDRLGVGYDAVSARNPEIVYCSLAGYGQTGPFRGRVGHSLNYESMAGMIDLTRDGDDEKPRLPGYPIADMAGGVFAVFAILGALVTRDRTGTGEYLDVSMTDAVLSFSQIPGYAALAGEDPRPGETSNTGANPWYGVYETADGRYLSIAAGEDKFWEAFCETVGREDLVEDREDPETKAWIRTELEDLFAGRPLEEWLDRLGDETMTAPVLRIEESIDHPQIRSRGVVRTPADGPARVGFPAISSAGFPDVDGARPDRGEHTEEVLRGFGLDDAEIDTLRDRGAF